MKPYRNRKLLEVVHVLTCQSTLDGCNLRPVQAAHSDDSQHGKCLSRKAHDCFIAAICGPSHGRPGCHYEIGSGHRLNREDRREAWRHAWRATFALLYAGGLIVVPKLDVEEWSRLTGGMLWPAEGRETVAALPGLIPDPVWLDLWQSGRAKVV